MSVDFDGWAFPGLRLTLGGREYVFPPPSVEDSKRIVAIAARTEIRFGLSKAKMPKDLEAEVQRLDNRPLGEITLGEGGYQQLVDDKVPSPTVERMAFYALFYWARGKDRADSIAAALWTPREEPAEGEVDRPGEGSGR